MAVTVCLSFNYSLLCPKCIFDELFMLRPNVFQCLYVNKDALHSTVPSTLFTLSVYNPQIPLSLHVILVSSVFKLIWSLLVVLRLGCWAGLEGRAVRGREAEDGHGSHVLPQVRRNGIAVVCHYTVAGLTSYTQHMTRECEQPTLLLTGTVSLF